jgi:hypothetical protein
VARNSFRHSFRVAPYPWRVYFFTDKEAWAKVTARKKFGGLKKQRDQADCSAGVCSCDPNSLACYVGVFDGGYGTLAHEMTHAAMFILASVGVRVTPNNNEALAYLVGNLVNECAGYNRSST